MNVKSRMWITVIALLCVVPYAYAGRGPDEMQFRERVQKMDQLMDRADSAKTASERELLLKQHMQEMRACMEMMKHENMDMSKGTASASAPMDTRMLQIEQRVDKMQTMMDQMLKQQNQLIKK